MDILLSITSNFVVRQLLTEAANERSSSPSVMRSSVKKLAVA